MIVTALTVLLVLAWLAGVIAVAKALRRESRRYRSGDEEDPW
jgi:hypothetical protein